MPVRHRQQHTKLELLKRKFIFKPIVFVGLNLGKENCFGKRFVYTIFLELAITIFYNHFTAAIKRTESNALSFFFWK